MKTDAIRKALEQIRWNETGGQETPAYVAALKELESLSSVPEDVARMDSVGRDVTTVREALAALYGHGHHRRNTAGTAVQYAAERALERIADEISRLATAAARVPGLELKLAACDSSRDAIIESLDTTKAERDAARQEVETLRTAYGNALTKGTAAEQEAGRLRMVCSNLETENARLTARVAELEEEKAALLNMEPVRVAREAEARATAAEASLKEVRRILGAGEVESAEGAAMRVAKKAGLREGSTSTLFTAPAPTPAPGLREAVGKAKAALEECLLRGSSDHADALCRVALDALAAYGSTPEPTVTHAALAAAAVATLENPKGNAGCRYVDCCASAVDEVLRRVTGGKVPEVLTKEQAEDILRAEGLDPDAETARVMAHAESVCAAQDALAEKAAKWDAVAHHYPNLETMSASPADTLPKARVVHELERVRPVWPPSSEHAKGLWDSVEDIAHGLGLTLPMGPGGGETKRHLSSCPQALDYALPEWQCNCAEVRAAFTEAATQRAHIPEPSHAEPVTLGKGPFQMLPDVAARAVERTHRTVTDAQPEPAAPEVVWEGDGVRVLADGTWEFFGESIPEWLPGNGSEDVRIDALARALVEAKRENGDLKTEVELKQAALDGQSRDYRDARKAAEAMRERAAKAGGDAAAMYDAAHGGIDHHTGPRCAVIAGNIRALPLEDK